VTLDVYAASPRGGRLEPREHACTRWVAASELRTLDWAAADVPVLPAVECFLAPDVEADRAWPRSVVSADWGKHPRKRAVWVAKRSERSWTLAREPALRGGFGLHGLLGLPLAFTRAAGIDRFLDFVAALARSGSLAAACTAPDDWAYGRPFFRVAAGARGLLGFVQAAGGRGVLLRQIELRTGAKPVFAVSGIPGTVGSGSSSLWMELAPMLADGGRDFRIWPFEGALKTTLERDRLTLAETYPRAAYAIALSAKLPAKLLPLAKTQRQVRCRAVAELQRAAWVAAAALDLRDAAAAVESEDDFDAMITAAAIVRLCAERAPLSCELVDRLSEGGILPTGMIELRGARR
jgi:hypothetical protein